MFGIFLKFFDFFHFAHLWLIFTDGRSQVWSIECMRSGLVAKISRFVSYSIVTDYSLLFQEVMTD